jgi:hypothetical protein
MAEAKLRDIIEAYHALSPLLEGGVRGTPMVTEQAEARPLVADHNIGTPAFTPEPAQLVSAFSAPAEEAPPSGDAAEMSLEELRALLHQPAAPKEPEVFPRYVPPPPKPEPRVEKPKDQPAAAKESKKADEEKAKEEKKKDVEKPRRLLPVLAVVGSVLLAGAFFGGGLWVYNLLWGPLPTVPKPQGLPLDNVAMGALQALHLRMVAASLPPVDPREEAEAEAREREQERASGRSAPRPRARQATQRTAVVSSTLRNGTDLIEPRGRRGVGRLRIVNRSGQDAIVRISSQAAATVPLRLIYLQSGGDVTLMDVGPGVYLISPSLGPITEKRRTFGRPIGPLQFLQVESANGTQSDSYEIVIKPRK